MIFVVLAVTWLVVAMAAALLIGAIRIADCRAQDDVDVVALPDDLTVDDVLGRPRTVLSAP